MESQSLTASRPKRNAAVPEHAQAAMNELKEFRLKRERVETSQKRKALADDHDTASQVEDEGSLKHQCSDAEALLGQYGGCETDTGHMKWLVAAILAWGGEDHRDSGLTIIELEEQWLDPKAAEEPGPDRHPGIAVGPISCTLNGADNSRAQLMYNSMPRKLMPTDSVTIGVGPTIYHHPQDLDGKHNKVEGYRDATDNDGTWLKEPHLKNAHTDGTHMDTPSHIDMSSNFDTLSHIDTPSHTDMPSHMDIPSKVGKLKATDSMTVGVGQPRVYHDLQDSNGKHRKIEGYTAYTRTPQGYMKWRVQQAQDRVPIEELDMRVTPVPQPQPQNNSALQAIRSLQLHTPTHFSKSSVN